MIGLDTNVLVRYFAQDDPVHFRMAHDLIHSLSAENPGWVSSFTVLEFCWVLTRIYGLKRNQILLILDGLLDSEEIVVEQSDTVRVALRLYRIGSADLPDCLIATSAKAAGCSRTVTFDRRAARDAGMQLLE